MTWMERYVRPRIRTLFRQPDVPDNYWGQCPACNHIAANAEMDRSLRVCSACGHHLRLTAEQRLRFTLDEGYHLVDLPKAPPDPLNFRDQKRYADRLREARTKTTMTDAVLAAHGTILGQEAVVAAMDFHFMGGSMGAAVGGALVAASREAVRRGAALVVFTASGGARMQEGAISLMQMPRTTVATMMLKEARLPYIVVFTDPTTGGVTASFAMLGDIHFSEPGAMIGFAGARVIEQTVRETLPEGFQRAEYLHAHGMVDGIVARAEMRTTLARTIGLLTRPMAEAGEEEALTW